MARRPGGKAASRKARQRKVQRAAPPSTAAPSPVAVPPVGTPDAIEAISLDPPRRASAPSPERAFAGSGSTLTERERAEYHYVERDLRNIGILSALLAVLMFVAWLAFSALGLAG
jgi:hypothetical protein